MLARARAAGVCELIVAAAGGSVETNLRAPRSPSASPIVTPSSASILTTPGSSTILFSTRSAAGRDTRASSRSARPASTSTTITRRASGRSRSSAASRARPRGFSTAGRSTAARPPTRLAGAARGGRRERRHALLHLRSRRRAARASTSASTSRSAASSRSATRTDLREAARLVPLDRLLVETDSPYLAPEPRRGGRNEPARVVDVAKGSRGRARSAARGNGRAHRREHAPAVSASVSLASPRRAHRPRGIRRQMP